MDNDGNNNHQIPFGRPIDSQQLTSFESLQQQQHQDASRFRTLPSLIMPSFSSTPSISSSPSLITQIQLSNAHSPNETENKQQFRKRISRACLNCRQKHNICSGDL